MKAEEAIGYTIRKLRKEMGWYSSQLARRVPMSRAYLCEVERGDNAPSISMMNDIATALQLRPVELWRAIADEMDNNA